MPQLDPVDYEISDEDNMIEARRTWVARGYTGDAATQIAAILAAAPAIGSTFYSPATKAYRRNVRPFNTEWLLEIEYRTEQFDDIIANAVDGTVVDKGFSAASETTFRTESPSQQAYDIGSFGDEYVANILAFEPRAVAWFDVVNDAIPEATIKDFVGAINNAVFLGEPVKTWLCVAGDTTTVKIDSGDRFLTRYEFSFKGEGWDARRVSTVYNSLDVSGITAGVRDTSVFEVYKNADFTTLGLSF